MIYGRIPREINLDLLVSSIDGNITKREHIRNGIIYMISRIHNEQLKSKDDNFVILNHKTLERIIGKGEGDRVGRIKKILLENGIIVVDGSFESSRHIILF